MSIMDTEKDVLIAEYYDHMRQHFCWYTESDDAGMARCPAEYPGLMAWLKANGISGQDSEDSNFGSENSGQENPVDEFSVERHWDETPEDRLRRLRTVTGGNNSGSVEDDTIDEELLLRLSINIERIADALAEQSEATVRLANSLTKIERLLDKRLARQR